MLCRARAHYDGQKQTKLMSFFKRS